MVAIRRFDLVSRVDDAVAVQDAALGPVAPDRASVFRRHASYRGFRAFGAFDENRLVGFGYGTVCETGQWWYDQIRPPLVRAGHGRWLDDAYAVTELHVLPEYQGRGIGRELLTRLLHGLPHRSALLSTYDIDSRARTLYRHLGFVDLVTGFRFPMQEQPYALMGAWLPLRPDR
jgi:ribosomal protein S18 acetylase RimI-like enzyme